MSKIFFNGWGISQNFLQSFLPCDIEIVDTLEIINKSFIDNKIDTSKIDDILKKIDTADEIFAWSAGALFLLSIYNFLPSKKNITLFSPTLQFFRSKENKTGIAPLAIKSMQAMISTDKTTMLKNFQTSCGINHFDDSILDINNDYLKTGLDFLLTTSLVDNSFEKKQTTVIFGQNDKIIPSLASKIVAKQLNAKTTELNAEHFLFEEYYKNGI